MLKHSTLDYRAYVIGVGAALGAAAIGAAGGTGGGLLRDYLNSRYEVFHSGNSNAGKQRSS